MVYSFISTIAGVMRTCAIEGNWKNPVSLLLFEAFVWPPPDAWFCDFMAHYLNQSHLFYIRAKLGSLVGGLTSQGFVPIIWSEIEADNSFRSLRFSCVNFEHWHIFEKHWQEIYLNSEKFLRIHPIYRIVYDKQAFNHLIWGLATPLELRFRTPHSIQSLERNGFESFRFVPPPPSSNSHFGSRPGRSHVRDQLRPRGQSLRVWSWRH